MFGGCNEAAEDDRVCTFSDQWLEQLRNCVEFRIGSLGQVLGLRHQDGERSVLFETRRRLDIDSIAFIRIFVENLSLQPIGIARRLRSALAAAAGEEPTQRIKASVPQNANRRRR